MSSASSADVLDDFKQQYQAADAKLEESYSHVEIIGTLTTCDSSGELFDRSDVEYLRDGLHCRAISITKDTERPEWPVGSITIIGGSEERFFLMVKAAGTKSFVHRSDGPYSELKKSLSYAMPYSRAFATREYPLGAFFDRKDVSLISAAASPDDGASAVRIVLEVAYPTYKQKAEFVFDRTNWALLRWSYKLGATDAAPLSNGRMFYIQNTNPPRMTSCEQWLSSPKDLSFKKNDEMLEIKTMRFEPISASKFTSEAAIADATSGINRRNSTMPSKD